ncbi:BTAD domain-containing putative transcriptional regulator [Nocardioides coralli]|uniref:BTAD domain-containing putative transcriptional regulator n=1 Tax=Nocardioides coralli TaxID=2872154 RepID=UPI001CA3DFF5|nr:BTAD domain-containing putative transcriptional regulator [Nocardioides coralli]QZY29118.1 AAA family ATPase [Nocardioides coralli]
MDGTRLQLRVLGELTATRDGAALDLGGRRQRAVLAALVIHRGEAVTADRLADYVWGDGAPANVAGALQAYVSHLRKRLQPEVEARRRDGVIARAGTGYALRVDPGDVDAWRFEAAVDAAAAMAPGDAVHVLDDALRLWRGQAYAEYAGEPWVEAEVTRLRELRAVARERLLAARLQLGDAAVLVGDLEALVAEDPLREERWRLLVLALYRAQRQADALAALRRARELLAEELGVDPGPALRTLEAEVLAHSPALDAPASAVPATPLVETARPGPESPSDLVDRSRETGLLRGLVGDLGAGRPGCVVIEGPAGIGKTRLLLETVQLATAAGGHVLSARGSDLERSYGFGVVRQLLEGELSDADRRERLLRGAAAGARAVVDDAGDHEHHGSFAVLHGLYWLTVNLAAETPLVIVVDDAQSCDSASLRYLAYLVRRLERLPVLVVLTVRTGEEGPEEALLAELALDPAVHVLRPQPLSAEATRSLVRERLGEGADSFVGACHRMTSGNPLLLRQLLRALADEGVRPDVSHVDTVRAVGSRAVSAQVTLRLRRMPPEATAVARAVAVLGDAAALPTVSALAQLPEDRTAAALDALSRGEILENRQPLRFVHPLVGEAVRDDLPAAERALHHERAAQLLREHGAPPEEVAAHLLVSPRRGDGATVDLLRRAALTASARGASDSAVLLLRRALEEPVRRDHRAGLLVELGLVETLVDGPAAAHHLTEAYELVEDPAERARIAMVIVRVLVFAAAPGVATSFARDAVAALPEGCDDERQGLLALQRITGYMHRLPPEQFRAGVVPEVSGTGDGARMLAATLSYELLLAGEHRERAVELGRFALAEDRLLEVDSGLLWIVAANVLQLADDDIGDFWDRALARAHATGGLFAALSANLWRGFTQGRRGHLDDALHSLADGTEQQRVWGVSGVTATYGAAFTIGVQVDRGDLAAAEAALTEARALPWLGEGGRLLHEAAARLRLEQGRPGEALAEITDLVEHCGIANPAWAPWRGLKAQALAGLGRTSEAVELAEEQVALLRQWGAASALGSGLRVLGEVRGTEGEAAPREAAPREVALREATSLLSGTDAAVETARARLALGQCRGVPAGEAVDLLRSALVVARTCGARIVARDAAAELERRGAPVDGGADRPVEPTDREQRILELVHEGLDADEVAQRLFLTPGTVRAVLEHRPGTAP